MYFYQSPCPKRNTSGTYVKLSKSNLHIGSTCVFSQKQTSPTQLAITLRPLRVEVNDNDHLTTMESSAMKPFILWFMWMPLEEQAYPHGTSTRWQCPPAGQCMLQNHNCSQTAKGTWQRAQGIDVAPEFSSSKSDWGTYQKNYDPQSPCNAQFSSKESISNTLVLDTSEVLGQVKPNFITQCGHECNFNWNDVL